VFHFLCVAHTTEFSVIRHKPQHINGYRLVGQPGGLHLLYTVHVPCPLRRRGTQTSHSIPGRSTSPSSSFFSRVHSLCTIIVTDPCTECTWYFKGKIYNCTNVSCHLPLLLPSALAPKWVVRGPPSNSFGYCNTCTVAAKGKRSSPLLLARSTIDPRPCPLVIQSLSDATVSAVVGYR